MTSEPELDPLDEEGEVPEVDEIVSPDDEDTLPSACGSVAVPEPGN
jgi:hypothetical protein